MQSEHFSGTRSLLSSLGRLVCAKVRRLQISETVCSTQGMKELRAPRYLAPRTLLQSGCLLLVFFQIGCTSTRHALSGTALVAEQAAVKNRLAEIFRAAEGKDFPRLDSYHAYGPQFTKFASSGNRMDTAAAREGEHTGLRAAMGLKLQADDLKIDVFGDTAVATFIAAVSFQSGADTVTKRERCTLVFVKSSGSWKIVHEHFSAAP
jgi:ketosteroid isomerase-like protein